MSTNIFVSTVIGLCVVAETDPCTSTLMLKLHKKNKGPDFSDGFSPIRQLILTEHFSKNPSSTGTPTLRSIANQKKKQAPWCMAGSTSLTSPVYTLWSELPSPNDVYVNFVSMSMTDFKEHDHTEVLAWPSPFAPAFKSIYSAVAF